MQWSHQQHAWSQWKSSQGKRPIHCKLTLTSSGWIPLPLTVSLLATQTEQLFSPHLQLSFTSTDWHVRSMCFFFLKDKFHLLLCPSCSSPFSAILSLPLSLTTPSLSFPPPDEDIVFVTSGSLHVSLCFLSLQVFCQLFQVILSKWIHFQQISNYSNSN